MKALLLCYASPTRTPPLPRTLPLRLLVWAMVMATWPLLAAPQVDTLSGGPSQAFPDPAGYVDGDTAADAQFNTPYAIASDPTGNILFVDAGYNIMGA